MTYMESPDEKVTIDEDGFTGVLVFAFNGDGWAHVSTHHERLAYRGKENTVSLSLNRTDEGIVLNREAYYSIRRDWDKPTPPTHQAKILEMIIRKADLLWTDAIEGQATLTKVNNDLDRATEAVREAAEKLHPLIDKRDALEDRWLQLTGSLEPKRVGRIDITY